MKPTPASQIPSVVRENAIGLTLEVHIDARELGRWPPETLAAFMNGLAAVLTARAYAEGLSPASAEEGKDHA